MTSLETKHLFQVVQTASEQCRLQQSSEMRVERWAPQDDLCSTKDDWRVIWFSNSVLAGFSTDSDGIPEAPIHFLCILLKIHVMFEKSRASFHMSPLNTIGSHGCTTTLPTCSSTHLFKGEQLPRLCSRHLYVHISKVKRLAKRVFLA